jgi:adenine-specific DNA-methyltransferase
LVGGLKAGDNTMANQEPEKLPGTSMDISAENRARLKQLFPSVFIETKNDKGELVESVDFEKLKAELGTFSDLFESRRERYGMDWPGKKEALRLIQTPSYATLKPCREESVDFDTTENLFIEGDNLEVLKLLQKSYYGKVKMIVTDPPYNTGNEFIYPDNYNESLETYLEYACLIDSEGKKFSTNTANEGRFHTKWLNMMYPRLYLARNLLRDDGVIFIHIDDNEVSNLRKVCEDIFGAENFISQITRVAKTTSFRGNFFAPSKDYILCFSKNISMLSKFSDDVNEQQYTKIEESGSRKGERYRDDTAFYLTTLETRPNQRYFIECPDGSFVIPPGKTMPPQKPEDGDGVWRWNKDSFDAKKELVVFKKSNRSPLITKDGKPAQWNLYTKTYLKDKQEDGNIPRDFFEGFLNRNGSEVLKKLDIPFDFPKPVELISYLAKIIGTKEKDIILDFFAGSATTAHAVLDLNKDGSDRKFILVQLPEPCLEDSEASKAGYKTIASIGKERIRRVIKKLNEEQEGKLDLDYSSKQDRGFKVLKLDKSSFKQWQQLPPTTPPDKIVEQLELHIDHIDNKDKPEVLLYEILLKTGFTPTEKIEIKTIAGKSVYSVADGGLLLCLEDSVTKELVDAIADLEPMQFICLDSAFHGNDQLKANAVQTFAARNMQKEKHNQIIFRTV